MEANGVGSLLLASFSVMWLVQSSAASSVLPVSIYTVTSRSITAQWSKYPGAHSFRVTATPVSGIGELGFVLFSGSTVIGTVISLTANTYYDVKVECLDNAGTVLSEGNVKHLSAPEVPVADKVYSKISNGITAEWAAVPGALQYELRAEANHTLYTETNVTESPGTVMGLYPATPYAVTIRSINVGGKSQPSRPMKATTVPAASVISSYSPSSDTIVANWDIIPAAVGYSVTIMRADGEGVKMKYNTTGTNFTFTGLEPDVLYTIVIHAVDATGIPGDDFTSNQETLALPPSGIQITPTTGEPQVTVSWNQTDDSLNYTVVASSPNSVLACTSSGISCTLSPLLCGTEYTISVSASNTAGPSLASNSVQLLTVPCAPGGINIVEIQPGNLSITWSPTVLTDYYIVFVKTDDGLELQCNSSLTECYFPSDCGFTYFINVFAYNKAGQSPAGDVLNYTTAPCCPNDITPIYVSGDTIEIIWSPVRGAELYETNADDGINVVHCNDTSTVCTLSALNCDSRYSISVYSYSEIRGVNNSCNPQYVLTAPCSPEIVNITKITSSMFTVYWENNNADANYTVYARAEGEVWSCDSSGTSCDLSSLPCGSMFSVSVVAKSTAGDSLPSYSEPLETAPCCPSDLTVTQITPSVTNVSWSPSHGAQTYVTMLESSKGQAKCHTLQTHCPLGCITCGTNYTVSVEAISESGLSTECLYQGYSSSACCPSGVKLYRLSNNDIMVYWRASGGSSNYIADLYGSKGNFTCSPTLGVGYCDIAGISCGDVYTVVVSPLDTDGSKVTFCPRKMYSVTCSGSSVGMVIYRGKRSVQ
ncbi:fibronectin type III domain-containing protein 7 [Protopterus annectens]|uniref:fibronectin type III domain-containing protein 7 n=1 Tax=Protopterus annectens TaxID=7888 RepID=UPI001CFA9AF4|nr:fibronectin type III domain-containing protein 7 [Protopterus annectens]